MHKLSNNYNKNREYLAGVKASNYKPNSFLSCVTHFEIRESDKLA